MVSINTHPVATKVIKYLLPMNGIPVISVLAYLLVCPGHLYSFFKPQGKCYILQESSGLIFLGSFRHFFSMFIRLYCVSPPIVPTCQYHDVCSQTSLSIKPRSIWSDRSSLSPASSRYSVFIC